MRFKIRIRVRVAVTVAVTVMVKVPVVPALVIAPGWQTLAPPARGEPPRQRCPRIRVRVREGGAGFVVGSWLVRAGLDVLGRHLGQRGGAFRPAHCR